MGLTSLGTNKSAFHRYARGFGAAVRAELCENVVHVALHGAFANEQHAGDFFVALAAGHQAKNFKFTCAEFRAFHSFGELSTDRRGDVILAAVDDTDAVNQIFEASVLQEVSASAGAQGTVNILIAFERSEDDDPRIAEAFTDRFDGLDAIHLRHTKINESDVRNMTREQIQRLLSGGGLANHGHIWDTIERGDEPFTHDRVIVGDH